MTNIYGIEPESAGWLEQESTNEMCPYCTGTNTQFIDFEFTNIDDLTHEKHFCWDCQLDFAVSYHPCPYLEEHLCRSH